jgi:fatty acid-binding protein DegV
MERTVAPGKVIETLLIPHTDCEEDAFKLADMVKEKFEVRNLEVILMCPVIGAHVGPGTVALVYEADITRLAFEAKYYS